eukprot:353770-Chlamydomonas_euryale.AAC.5
MPLCGPTTDSSSNSDQSNAGVPPSDDGPLTASAAMPCAMANVVTLPSMQPSATVAPSARSPRAQIVLHASPSLYVSFVAALYRSTRIRSVTFDTEPAGAGAIRRGWGWKHGACMLVLLQPSQVWGMHA